MVGSAVKKIQSGKGRKGRGLIFLLTILLILVAIKEWVMQQMRREWGSKEEWQLVSHVVQRRLLMISPA
jgi:uncharacterized membrane protein